MAKLHTKQVKEEKTFVEKYRQSFEDYCQDVAFVKWWDEYAKRIYLNAKAHGFWPKNRNVGEAIALIHSEVSEGLEAHRHGNPPDDKVPQFDGLTAELADAVIRIMDLGAGLKLPIGKAIVAKMLYNKTRPHKHGKKF